MTPHCQPGYWVLCNSGPNARTRVAQIGGAPGLLHSLPVPPWVSAVLAPVHCSLTLFSAAWVLGLQTGTTLPLNTVSELEPPTGKEIGSRQSSSPQGLETSAGSPVGAGFPHHPCSCSVLHTCLVSPAAPSWLLQAPGCPQPGPLPFLIPLKGRQSCKDKSPFPRSAEEPPPH